MKLKDFIRLYTGYAGIFIEGYCEGEMRDEVEQEQWWKEAGERQVVEFEVIGNVMDIPELHIYLED